MTAPTKTTEPNALTQNGVCYSHYDIAALIAADMGVKKGDPYEVVWQINGDAVIWIPLEVSPLPPR